MAGSFTGSLPPSVNESDGIATTDGGVVRKLEEPPATPALTVAMPVYNAGPYLRQAVLSIINQTFTDWELLIIDDASTDGAIESIADIADARIRVVRNARNLGLAATLNIGIDLARGKYFARMDQDDVSYPDRLGRQVAMLDENPDIDLLAVRCVTIDAGNQLLGVVPYAITHEEICARPWRGFYLAHPTWMGRLEWFRRHRYGCPGPYLCEDQELLLRTYRVSRFAIVPEVLFAYRLRERIDWTKAILTRRKVLAVQIKEFVGLRQWDYVMLSVATFVGRVAKDVLSVLTSSRMARLKHLPAIEVEAVERQRWLKILESGKLGTVSNFDEKLGDRNHIGL